MDCFTPKVATPKSRFCHVQHPEPAATALTQFEVFFGFIGPSRCQTMGSRRNRPVKRLMTSRTINRKKRNCAMPAAPDAIPPNPKIPAIIAKIKNVSAQESIVLLRVSEMFKCRSDGAVTLNRKHPVRSFRTSNIAITVP